MRFVLTSLLFFQALGGWLWAQEEADATQKAPLSKVPCPLELERGWQKFLEVEPPELDERVEQMMHSLKACFSALSPEEQEALSPLFQRIDNNLQSYISLSKMRLREPTLRPLQEKPQYSLADLINAGRTLRRIQQDIKAERLDLENTEALLKSEETELERLTQEYRKLERPTQEKLVIGLQMMGLRSSLLVRREKIREIKEDVNRLKTRYDELDSHMQQARERLSFSDINLASLDEQMEEERIGRRKARVALLEAEHAAAQPVVDTPAGRLEEDLRQLAILEALIALNERSATLIGLDVERLLFLWVHEQVELSSSKVGEQLSHWKSELSLLYRQAESWERTVQERLQEAVTGSAQLQTLSQEDQQVVGELTRSYLKGVQEVAVQLSRLITELADIRFLIMQLEAEVSKHGSVAERVVVRVKDWWAGAWPEINRVLSFRLFKIGESSFTLWSLIDVIIIFAVAALLSWVLRRILRHHASRRGLQAMSTVYTVGRLLHYLIFVVAILIVLARIGLDLEEMAIVLGGLSVGIGIGLRDFVTNFVSGLMILFERNLRLGDFIELETGQAGSVSAINMQNSVIRTFDGVDVIVPNASIVGSRLINWTMQDPYQRLRIPFAVAYGTDKELVSQVVLDAADRLPITLEPELRPGPNQVWLMEFGESSLNFELLVWVNLKKVRYGRSRAAYLWEIESTLREHGIRIPFPQRDVHLDWEQEEKGKETP